MLERIDRALARGRVRRAIRPTGLETTAAAAAGIDKIQHIVVLMMENHSYDGHLGMLQGRGDGFTLGPDGQPVDPHGNHNRLGQLVPLQHAPSPDQLDELPSQTWADSHIQWSDGACDGFVSCIDSTTAERQAAGMRYFTKADLPFYYSLARTFPIATRWFCSCLGPTFPNRRFLISATANGLIDDVYWGLTDQPPAGTVFDQLTANGISWANFHNKPLVPMVLKSLFGRHGLSVARHVGLFVSGFVPHLESFLEGELQFSADMYPMDPVEKLLHAPSLRTFFKRARAGTLPSVSIVDPDYGKFSEEDPQDVQNGESFAAAVIKVVMESPCWPSTVLFWLYDEHGGYYDHVPPPSAVAPDDVLASSLAERHPLLRRLWFLRKPMQKLEAADKGPRTYDHYGFRVPAVIVSPFSRPDFVSDTVYDHTSILKLIELRWGLASLTRRDASASAPLDALDLVGPPAFLEPPALHEPAAPGAWEKYLR